MRRLIAVTQAGLLYNLQPSQKVPQSLSWDVMRRCSRENNLITCCSDPGFYLKKKNKKSEWVIYFCLLVSKSPATSLTKITAKAGEHLLPWDGNGTSLPSSLLAFLYQDQPGFNSAGTFCVGEASSRGRTEMSHGTLCPGPGRVSPATNPSIPALLFKGG